MVKSNGKYYAIQRIKLWRLLYTRKLCGQPLKSYPDIVGIDKDGFPKKLHFLKEVALQFDKPQNVRFILTLLSISRAIPVTREPDFSTITAPYKGVKPPLEVIPDEFIVKFCKDRWLRVYPEDYRSGKDLKLNFFSTKAGPMGAATSSAFEYIPLLTEHIKGAIGSLIGDSFIMRLCDIEYGLLPKIGKGLFTPKKKSFGECLRRLSIVNDPEGKARVIAILDYYSQVSLKSLHDGIYEALREIPEDRTFSQDPKLDPREGHHFHSLDLTAATDRFPRELTARLIDQVWSKNKGRAWSVLMTKEPFLTPKGDKVTYSVGQPMGAYSSWAAFALSHHLIVQYAAFLAGVYPFKGYILLGDDIVINHDEVAAQYVKIMNDLGVDISPMKTHVSKDTYEFAKRWFHRGIEVTGVQLRGFISEIKSPLLILSHVQNMYMKGQIPRLPCKSPDLVMGLYHQLSIDKIFSRKTKRCSFVLSARKISSIRNNIVSIITVQSLVKSFNYDKARAFLIDIGYSGHICLDVTILEKLFSRVTGVALGDTAADTIKGLLQTTSNFNKQLESKWASVDPIYKIDWNTYSYIPVYWGLLRDIMSQSKANKLFDNMNGVAETIAQVLVPASESAFSERKKVLMARGYHKLTRSLIKYMIEDPEVKMELGKSTKLALSWSEASADFKLLGMSPKDRHYLELQRYQAQCLA